HLQKLASRMPLYVEEGYTATLGKKLRNGELDVIIVALPFTEPDVVTQPLFDESFVVLMPHDHPLANKEAIDPSDLDDQDVLLLGEGHCSRVRYSPTGRLRRPARNARPNRFHLPPKARPWKPRRTRWPPGRALTTLHLP